VLAFLRLRERADDEGKERMTSSRQVRALHLVGVILGATSLMGLAGCGSGDDMGQLDGGLDATEDGAVEASDHDAKREEAGSPCTKEGSTQACGNCGTQTCESTGLWGICTGQGVCAPGATKDCSLGIEHCSSTCTWGACSCPTTPECKPGATEACGHCGTATCDSCGAWGACANEGVCAPGDMAPDGCYMGAEATCNSSCDWVCP